MIGMTKIIERIVRGIALHRFIFKGYTDNILHYPYISVGV